MIDKVKNKKLNDLLRDLAIIILLMILFLIIMDRFGGNISDYITEKSCNAINEKYIQGKEPGYGVCVKTSGNIDIKK